MAIKNQAKFKKEIVSKVGKRFSKAKMKREMVSENTVDIEQTVKQSKNSEQSKTHVCLVAEIFKFKGEPKRVYSAILKRNSSQQKGYDVLSKGQQVTVEDFGSSQPLRIKSMDGRIGITSESNVKPLSFS